MNIGLAIKNCREAKRFSKTELAEKADLTPSYIALLEKGNRTPNLKALESIGAALGVPVSLLVFIATDKAELPYVKESTRSELLKAIEEFLRQDATPLSFLS